MKLKIYEYPNCSTCKKALKFLAGQGVEFEQKNIVETPPSVAELKAMAGYYDGNFRKLFNTSGVLYKEMKLSEKVGAMSESEALALLAKHGKLIKRPFLLAAKSGLVGFDEKLWKSAVS